MYSGSGKFIQISGLLVLSLVCATSQAAFERDLTYTGSLEGHSDDSDEVVSELTLRLSDERFWSQYSNEYNLEFRYLYEHQDNESNDQIEGYYIGAYQIRKSTIVWDIIANSEVLTEESGQEVDNFSSQNLTTLTTGPRINLFRSLRGDTTLSFFVTDYNYSESELDSFQENISLRHIYPISENQRLLLDLNHVSLEYDDSINESSDYDADNFNVAYEATGSSQTIRLRVGFSDIDNDSNPDNQEDLELNYIYRVNPRSSLRLELADSLQTSAEFNEGTSFDRNELFEASLLRVERALLGYSYVRGENLFEAEVYTERIEPIFSEDTEEEIDGGTVRYIRRVGEEWTYLAEFEVSENDVLDDRFKSLTASVIYRRQHTRDTASEIELSVEADESDSESVEDYILIYRLESVLFN